MPTDRPSILARALRPRAHRLLIALACLLLTLMALAAPAAPALAQSDARCFAETGLCISGRIRQFWEQNGGLLVFGLPITDQHEEPIEGKPTTLQWFERNRLELHPEAAPPYDVQLGRLGADRLAQQGRDWFGFPKDPPPAGCRAFSETGHAVCGEILRAWRASGLELDNRRGKSEAESLALFGMPLSDMVTETRADGTTYQAQWFERARFEIHPDNPPAFRILLGLLGSEVRAAPSTPAPAPPAAPPVCEVPAAPSDSTVAPACLHGGEKLSIVARGLTPKDLISLELAAPDGKLYEFAIIYGDPAVRPDGHYFLDGALQPGVPPGIYTLTIRGHKSGVTAAIPFRITAGPPSGPDASALPPNVGGPTASVSPTMARRTLAFFSFHTDGALPPDVEVEIYATHPDGKVVEADFYLRTNQDGGVRGDLQLITEKSDPYGIYSTTFEVIGTGQKVILYCRVVPEQ